MYEDYKYKVEVIVSNTSSEDDQTITNNIKDDISALLGEIEEKDGEIVSFNQTHLTPEKLQTTVVYLIND